MTNFEFTVKVKTDTFDQALQVIQERVEFEEDYGFNYSISYEVVSE